MSPDGVSRRSSAAAVLALLALLICAGITHVPWRVSPFPVEDFGYYLNVFQLPLSMLDRWEQLVRQYASEGRFQPFSMLALSLMSSVAGIDPATWQWIRFVSMIALSIAAYLLIRRFALSPLAAFAGALLFVIADAAGAGWHMPQVMEHVGTAFLFGAAALALRYQQSQTPVSTALGIAALLACAVYVKEPLIATVPFVVLIALCMRARNTVAPPQLRSRHTLVLITVCGGVLLLANVLPVLLIRANAPPTSYGAQYSLGSLTFAQLSNALRATMLPLTRVPAYPPNALFLAVVVAGWWLRFSRSPSKNGAAWSAIIFLSLPLCGALLYAPWRGFPGYYALPFLLGSALLFAFAIETLASLHSPITKWATAASVGALLVFGVTLGHSGSARYRAQTTVRFRAAEEIARRTNAPELLVAGPASTAQAHSGTYAAALRGYMMALFGRAPQVARDIPCDGLGSTVASPSGSVLLSFSDLCATPAAINGSGALAARVIEPFVRRDWRLVVGIPDSITATAWTFGPTHHEH